MSGGDRDEKPSRPRVGSIRSGIAPDTTSNVRAFRPSASSRPSPLDETVDLDCQRHRIVAEVVRVRPGAQAELRAIARAGRFDLTIRSDQRDAIPLFRRRPQVAPDIVARAAGVDPLEEADIRRARSGRREAGGVRAHPSIQQWKPLGVHVAQRRADGHERDRNLADEFGQSPAAPAEKANWRYTNARYSTPPTMAPGGPTIANVLVSHERPRPSHVPSRSDQTIASRRRPRESTFVVGEISSSSEGASTSSAADASTVTSSTRGVKNPPKVWTRAS